MRAFGSLNRELPAAPKIMCDTRASGKLSPSMYANYAELAAV